MNSKVRKLVILASGGGSNAGKIAEYFSQKDKVEIALLACNRKEAGVWSVAEDYEIEKYLLTKQNFLESDDFLTKLNSIKPDLIVLAGFLWKIPESVIKAFPNKMINIHPSLLPKFGGKGMYGKKVHEAVISSDEEFSGITVHYVNENYDEGHIIFQKILKLDEGETPETLEKKIHVMEHENFPLVIDFLLRNDY